MDPTQDFENARNNYRSARWQQRKLIVAMLEEAGFTVKSRGTAGRGLSNYTSGSRLNPPFDLSNWLWVLARKKDVNVLITLQVLDQDPNSLNIHALYDRIGLDVFKDTDPVDESDPLAENKTTSLELPLSDADLKHLLDLIERKSNDLQV